MSKKLPSAKEIKKLSSLADKLARDANRLADLVAYLGMFPYPREGGEKK